MMPCGDECSDRMWTRNSSVMTSAWRGRRLPRMPGKGSEAGYTHQRIYRRTRHGDRETPADDRSRHNVRGPIRQAVVPDLHGKRSRIARNLTRSEWSRHSDDGHLRYMRLSYSWSWHSAVG